ncbi:hypothetical protein E2C01_004471 [Portunus trituberculatus]|uniref:Uncharacterized protein n=1 Tax=Portunus trituberculatus TaxID=210409 RepID=A0A5B7CPV7_PORTR|nr:hypothetical protein [Portunus trituberculatus]
MTQVFPSDIKQVMPSKPLYRLLTGIIGKENGMQEEIFTLHDYIRKNKSIFSNTRQSANLACGASASECPVQHHCLAHRLVHDMQRNLPGGTICTMKQYVINSSIASHHSHCSITKTVTDQSINTRDNTTHHLSLSSNNASSTK